MAYEEIGDLTTTDWTLFGIGAGLLFIGIFLSGQKIENILGIWSRRNFVGFSVLAGIGTLGALLSVRLDEGMLTEWLGEGSVDWANTLGGLSALVWVAAIASAARISKDSMVPAVFGIIFAAVGWGVLFGSALSSSSTIWRDTTVAYGWDAYPLIPLNVIFAALLASILASLCTGAIAYIVSVIRGAGEGQAEGTNVVAGLLVEPK